MPESVLHIPLYHQTWVIALMLALFVVFVLAFMRSHNWLVSLYENFSKAHISSSSTIKRTAEEQQSRLLMTIFSSATIVLYIGMYASNFIEINFLIFLKIFALTIGFILIKEQVARFIGFVFFSKDAVKLATEQYLNLVFLFSTILYPLLVLRCFWLENIHTQWIDLSALILLGLAVLLIIIILFQFFYKNILDGLHILLYLCTLEILPYFGMYYAFQWVMIG